MQPASSYSVKKLLVMERIRHGATFGKRLGLWSADSCHQEKVAFVPFMYPGKLPRFWTSSHLLFSWGLFSNSFWKYAILGRTPGLSWLSLLWHHDYHWAIRFFVVAHYTFCNAKLHAIIRKILYSSSKCLHFFFRIYHDLVRNFEFQALP